VRTTTFLLAALSVLAPAAIASAQLPGQAASVTGLREIRLEARVDQTWLWSLTERLTLDLARAEATSAGFIVVGPERADVPLVRLDLMADEVAEGQFYLFADLTVREDVTRRDGSTRPAILWQARSAVTGRMRNVKDVVGWVRSAVSRLEDDARRGEE